MVATVYVQYFLLAIQLLPLVLAATPQWKGFDPFRAQENDFLPEEKVGEGAFRGSSFMVPSRGKIRNAAKHSTNALKSIIQNFKNLDFDSSAEDGPHHHNHHHVTSKFAKRPLVEDHMPAFYYPNNVYAAKPNLIDSTIDEMLGDDTNDTDLDSNEDNEMGLFERSFGYEDPDYVPDEDEDVDMDIDVQDKDNDQSLESMDVESEDDGYDGDDERRHKKIALKRRINKDVQNNAISVGSVMNDIKGKFSGVSKKKKKKVKRPNLTNPQLKELLDQLETPESVEGQSVNVEAAKEVERKINSMIEFVEMAIEARVGATSRDLYLQSYVKGDGFFTFYHNLFVSGLPVENTHCSVSISPVSSEGEEESKLLYKLNSFDCNFDKFVYREVKKQKLGFSIERRDVQDSDEDQYSHPTWNDDYLVRQDRFQEVDPNVFRRVPLGRVQPEKPQRKNFPAMDEYSTSVMRSYILPTGRLTKVYLMNVYDSANIVRQLVDIFTGEVVGSYSLRSDATYDFVEYNMDDNKGQPHFTIEENPEDLVHSKYGWTSTIATKVNVTKKGVTKSISKPWTYKLKKNEYWAHTVNNDQKETKGNNVITFVDNSKRYNKNSMSKQAQAGNMGKFKLFNGGKGGKFLVNGTDLEANGNFPPEVGQVNAFYHANRFHDILSAHGFDETSGNFQIVNDVVRPDDIMSRSPGKIHDPVFISVGRKAQSDTHRSHISVLEDGVPSVMELVLCKPSVFAGGEPIDESLAVDIVIHELMHGVTSRLVGGKHTVNCMRTEISDGIAEGVSDAMAILYTRTSQSTRKDVYVLGEYVARCSRKLRYQDYTEYSRELGVKVGYKRISTSLSISKYLVGTTFGLIIWDLYFGIQERNGGASSFKPLSTETSDESANSIVLSLLVNGMKLLGCNIGFVKFRDAMLLADELKNDSKYKCLIWNAFAKYGVGYEAKDLLTLEEHNKQDVSSRKVHPDCRN